MDSSSVVAAIVQAGQVIAIIGAAVLINLVGMKVIGWIIRATG